MCAVVFFFKQKTAYEMRISDWGSDVCSSDLSTGRSAVAAVADRAGVALENERDGLVHDYTRRSGVEDAFIVVPEGAEWAQDRSALWNAAEAAEKRKDAKVAREYELGLPAELDAGQRRDLVRAFAEDIRDRYGGGGGE